MKLLTYRTPHGLKLGLVIDGRVYEASLSVADFVAQGLAAVPALQALQTLIEAQDTNQRSALENDLTLAPVVPHPGKILCTGLNYAAHAAESNHEVPERPVLFSKFNNALTAAGQPVALAPEWTRVDYEAELAVVIGRRGRRIPAETALDHVLGYCCANDVSERNLQYVSGQWLLGKSLDGFLPLGPYLVTADEVGDPQNLEIRGRLNGELRQSSHTSRMIFPVAELIAYASRTMTLEPGDVILTGTPDGVVKGRADQRYLRPGDRYVVEIERLGRLETPFVAE